MSAGAGWRLLALLERLSLGGDSASDPVKLRWNPSATGAKAEKTFAHGESALETLKCSSDPRLPAKKTNNLA